MDQRFFYIGLQNNTKAYDRYKGQSFYLPKRRVNCKSSIRKRKSENCTTRNTYINYQ